MIMIAGMPPIVKSNYEKLLEARTEIEYLKEENERLKAEVTYWQQESSQVRKNESHLLILLDNRDKQIEQLKKEKDAQLIRWGRTLDELKAQLQKQKPECQLCQDGQYNVNCPDCRAVQPKYFKDGCTLCALRTIIES